jgi:hypothetical protein
MILRGLRTISGLFAPVVAAAALAAGFAGGMTTTPAMAFTGGNFPACSEQRVLDHMARRFVWTDEHVIQRGLRIDDITHTHQNKYAPATDTHLVGRRYCHATAWMNDGSKRQMWYLIEQGMGFAGIRDNVEFCISGLDPWHVYGAWCRSVR